MQLAAVFAAIVGADVEGGAERRAREARVAHAEPGAAALHLAARARARSMTARVLIGTPAVWDVLELQM